MKGFCQGEGQTHEEKPITNYTNAWFCFTKPTVQLNTEVLGTKEGNFHKAGAWGTSWRQLLLRSTCNGSTVEFKGHWTEKGRCLNKKLWIKPYTWSMATKMSSLQSNFLALKYFKAGTCTSKLSYASAENISLNAMGGLQAACLCKHGPIRRNVRKEMNRIAG